MTQAGLYALLVGNSELNTLTELGQIIGGRLTPVLLPEGSPMPAMTYRIVASRSEPTFSGSGAQKLRVQFDAYSSDTYDNAAAARDALRSLLNGYSGTLSDGTFLQAAELIQQIDFYENDARQFRCMSEFYLSFNFPD
jgi:hypothetical protein